ncbi:MAG: response regulator [Abditibacteriaceae bacterium]
MNVLLLDDNTELCNFLVANLHENVIDSKGVNNITDALTLLRNEKFDALIVDIQLGDEDGFDFIQKVRENRSGKSIPVMLTSEYDTTLARRMAADYACNAFLSKPFTTTQLVDALRGLSTGTTLGH